MFYNFEPSLSFADPSTIEITTLNPPYLAAVSHAGNEGLLKVAYTAVIERELFAFLQTTFWRDSQTFLGAAGLNSTMNQVIQQHILDTGSSFEQAQAWFFNLWANTTTSQNNPTLDALAVPLNQPSLPTATQISFESASAIFDPMDPFSLVHPPTDWFDNSMAHWKNSLQNGQIALDLASHFNLTIEQVIQVATWSNSTGILDNVMSPYIFQTYHAESLVDIACLQWGQASYASTVSVASLYPSLFPAGPIEFAFWSKVNSWPYASTVSVETCKMMLPLGDALTFGNFMKDLAKAIETGNITHIKLKWGIETTYQASQLAVYYLQISNKYGAPAVGHWLSNGSGLFATRTAHEWLWDYTDPLVIRLLPDAPPQSFKHNYTSPEMAVNRTRPWVINSGVTDITQLQNTIAWDGLTSVPFYGEPYQVFGQTEDGQFPPFINCATTKLSAWVDDYAKNFPMICIDDNVPVYNVRTNRYIPTNSTWAVNPIVENFVEGFSNISAKYNDSPVFLSNPHFYAAPDRWLDRIAGDATKRNLSIDWTAIDIEPYTGKVVRFVKGLQANLYIKNDTLWFYEGYNPKMYRDVMFPVMYGRQTSTTTKQLTKLVTGTVYVALKVKVVIQWVLVGLCSFLALLSLVLLLASRRRPQNDGYMQIN